MRGLNLGKISICSDILETRRFKEVRRFVGQEMGRLVGYVTCSHSGSLNG